MPRQPRPVIAGQPMHITQRGNNRTVTFVAPDDYGRFTQILRVASERAGCVVHAYVLMTNHVHLLVTPSDASGPARLMQSVGIRYVRYFNDRYGRTGTLWEGRFRSARITSSDYFLSASRYIELNPVRAGMVTHPDQHAWSSYRYNAYGEADALVGPHDTYRSLGGCPTTRQAAYRDLFKHHIERALADARRLAELLEE